ncbi:MAG TPA: YdiU family protein [Caulobacteraceae bacterium]
MPLSSDIFRPEPRLKALGGEFFDPVEPADFPAAVLRWRNDRAAAAVGLADLGDAEWIGHFARFRPLPGGQGANLALRYHGHQFRSYNPDLGDGRGFLFDQLREASTGRLLDLGTKGSGTTPWSRGADGRLTLKGGVREVLATEMLEALGVPTSRTFSLIETGEDLVRGDEPSPTRSAVLVRLSQGHVRFGTFQRLAWLERPDLIETLIGHVAETYYPELDRPDAPALLAPALLNEVVARSARLTARWMAAGFVHGVLNTDNMNMSGESFDYGPYRFLPFYEPGFTAAYFDHSGLYAFARQPEAVFWNLTQLAGCFTLVAEREPLIEAMNTFGPAYARELQAAFCARLGVRCAGYDADAALVEAALTLFEVDRDALRWEPLFFDWFCGDAARAARSPRAAAYDSDAGRAFAQALAAHEPDRPERLAHPYFSRAEPEELLYPQIEALWADIAERDDWSAFEAKIAAIREAGAAYAL